MNQTSNDRSYQVQPLEAVARELGLPPDAVVPYGRNKAKIDLTKIPPTEVRGKLVLVSAINPTPAGEGKTTTSIGLAMGLRRLGRRVALCLREPSLGPVFGVKGGGTGGGMASLFPADDINLHFTGDLHAITTANNLLSAIIDNALHFGDTFGATKTRLDARALTWGRALDMNDRALRNVVVGLGTKGDGVPRQERFDITAASEVMAILALSLDFADLERRLSRIIVGANEGGEAVTAAELGAASAMAALLKDALMPNLVQTREGGPAIVHAGPFANIAHGCNSVVATRLGLQFSDITVTEAGFGLDLGGEKFINIKCRQLGQIPDVVVLVATLRALKMHGGAPVKESGRPNREALSAGLPHLQHHLECLKSLGLPTIVAINRFPTDLEEEIELVIRLAGESGARTIDSQAFTSGGEGGIELARVVSETLAHKTEAPATSPFVYELTDSVETKLNRVAHRFYGATRVNLSAKAKKNLARIKELGAEHLPICFAKTQLSLTDDPTRPGKPTGFEITVRELRLSNGAGFIVALTGDLMTMPGLPREPAARNVRIDAEGNIRGLMQNET